MSGLDSRLFCRLDGLSAAAREQQRLLVVADLGLLEADSNPIFEEAAQTAAQFLQTPVSWLGVMDRDYHWLRAAIGLSRLGLMNPIAKQRRLSREESFCAHVVDSHMVLAIGDTLEHPALAQSILVQHYGIRAYMGAPLMISSGHCLGTLAVLDLVPRQFEERDVQSLELIARWCISEYERDATLTQQRLAEATGQGGTRLVASGSAQSAPLPPLTAAPATKTSAPHSGVALTPGIAPNPLRLQLVGQLTQQLRAPLTAVLGMAGMLNREIYGPLTDKQREYLDVIHRSGQTLLSLIQEIMDLAALEESQDRLNVTPVDVELLCQQTMHTLMPVASQREIELRFSIEPGQRIWHLDKDKVRQMLYHLMFSIIQSANTESILRLHVSRKQRQIQFSLWVSHPWLGDGLPPNDGSEEFLLQTDGSEELEYGDSAVAIALPRRRSRLGESSRADNPIEAIATERPEGLRLLLSRHLAEMQGGQLFVQSSLESGYRYIALLPVGAPENDL